MIDGLGTVVAGLGFLAALFMALVDSEDPLNALAILGSLVTACSYFWASFLLSGSGRRPRAGLFMGAVSSVGPAILIYGMRLAETPWDQLIPYWMGL
jgi:hypothetical protein